MAHCASASPNKKSSAKVNRRTGKKRNFMQQN
jgi:hypothetical protein